MYICNAKAICKIKEVIKGINHRRAISGKDGDNSKCVHTFLNYVFVLLLKKKSIF